jgi:hypothetical protein
MDSIVYLPSVADQTRSLELDAKLRDLAGDVASLQRSLWSDPSKARGIEASVRKINRSDSLNDWISTLPFPIASSLVSVQSVSDNKDKYERLLSFFESVATLLATIHLSAIDSQPELARDLRSSLNDQIGQLSKRASFGHWVSVVSKMAAELRKLLGNKDQSQLCNTMYVTEDPNTLSVLSSKKLSSILENVVSKRNDWRGHTGIVGSKEASDRLKLLFDYVADLREVFGTFWEEYLLIMPRSMQLSAEAKYEVEIGKAIGPLYQFERVKISLTGSVVSGQFQMWDEYQSETLPLIPFVRMMSTTSESDNACYFYNRTDSKGIRFISHHYELESERHVDSEIDPISSAFIRLEDDGI